MRALIVVLVTLASPCFGQAYHRPSHDAAILSDERYQAGDGTFGAAYTQEDGVEFKEESDANGDRKGSYSYVDPTGHRRTVFYTAGKNGFQVRDELKASGDHIPTARPVVAPQPEYEPLPEYNPPDYRPPPIPRRPHGLPTRPQSHYSLESIYQSQPEPRYYPGPQYRPPPPPPPPPSPPQYNPGPQTHFRPQTRPHQYRYAPDPQLEPDFNQQRQQQQQQFEYEFPPQYQPPPQTPPPRPEYRPPPTSRLHDQYNQVVPTPIPRRFYPPGKLDFNRTPDGFSYTFSKS